MPVDRESYGKRIRGFYRFIVPYPRFKPEKKDKIDTKKTSYQGSLYSYGPFDMGIWVVIQ